ncbi:MAG: hypothetical protein ACQEXX_25130 [Bacillota bacterium]
MYQIDYYTDGYKGIQLNCVDLPLAALAGYYSYENYFYYSFYISLMENWIFLNKDGSPVINREEVIMNKLGLYLKEIYVESHEKLIFSIHSELTKGHPIFLIVKYSTLFYLDTYLTDNNYNHGLIIEGYDSEKRILILRERLIGNKVTSNFLKGDPFFKFRITEDMLLQIWKDTNKLNREEGNSLYNKFYSVIKHGESKIENYSYIVTDFLEMYKVESSFLYNLKANYEQIFIDQKDQNLSMFFRRKYFGSLTILFENVEKLINSFIINKDYLEKYHCIKNEFLSFRDRSLTKIHLKSLRNKKLDHAELDEMICKEEIISSSFIFFLKDIINSISQRK